MDIDNSSIMETPRSSVDGDATLSTQHNATPNGDKLVRTAATHHIVPTIEPALDHHHYKHEAATVQPELAISGFKATNNGANTSYQLSFAHQKQQQQQLKSQADFSILETHSSEGTPFENDSAGDNNNKPSGEPAPSITEGPASISLPADGDEAAVSSQFVPSPEDDLSPPPDSIDDQILEDQIVVAKGKSGHANATTNTKKEAHRELHDDGMDEGDDDDDTLLGNRHPKRKRNSLYDDLAEEKMDSTLGAVDEEGALASTPPASEIPQTAHVFQVKDPKPIILGYWRESDAPEPDQHVVKGFIDSRDRLRTRIQTHNRAGDIITNRYPLKPGPGGSWVTFHNIVFDEHLVHLDQHQVKEYVKIRTAFKDKEGEDSRGNDKAAVQKAIKVTQARGPLPEAALPPLIAYGAVIPDHARISYSRAEKRRRTADAKSSQGTPESQMQLPQQPQQQQQQQQPQQQQQQQQRLQAGPGPVFSQPMMTAPNPPIPAELPGKRPTKIMLGYWLESIEAKLEDKHAVFGILGNNDMFRVKVGRETRDGRPMQSNFPQGAGALWINAHQWKREDYLEDFSREELKEYCRVRQWQLEKGERDEAQQAVNIEYAINEARRRAAYLGANKKMNNSHVLPPNNHFTEAILAHDAPSHETRQAIRRSGPPAIIPANSFNHEQAQMTPSFRNANRASAGTSLPPSFGANADPRHERTNNLAMNAVSRIEANQAKVEERDAHVLNATPYQMSNGKNGHSGHVGPGGDGFRDNLGRLNNVWSQQEAQRLRTGNEDAKIHMGTKYERKATGPFAGKLVSQGNIINIAGEDYVEYRVLTQPKFI